MACPLEAYSTPLQKHTVDPKRPHPRPTSTLRTCRAAANWIRTGLLSEKEVDDLLGLLFEHELAYVRHLLQFPLACGDIIDLDSLARKHCFGSSVSQFGIMRSPRTCISCTISCPCGLTSASRRHSCSWRHSAHRLG